MIAVIALIIAAGALILNIIRWKATHRPYIGVVALDWETISEEHMIWEEGDLKGTAYPDSVRCMVKNIGETPAKAIKFEGKVRVRSGEKARKLDLSILLPGQEMEVVLPFDVDKDNMASDFLGGYGSAEVWCKLDYSGVLPRQHYFTKQHFAITGPPARWTALPGGECS